MDVHGLEPLPRPEVGLVPGTKGECSFPAARHLEVAEALNAQAGTGRAPWEARWAAQVKVAGVSWESCGGMSRRLLPAAQPTGCTYGPSGRAQ